MNEITLILKNVLEPIRDNCQELVITPVGIHEDYDFNSVSIDLEVLGQPRSFINKNNPATNSFYRIRLEPIKKDLYRLEMRSGVLSPPNVGGVRFTTTLFKREFEAINLVDLERESTKAVSDLLEFIS